MKGVFWKKPFSELAMVVTIDEKLNVSGEGLHASGEASGFASQTFQVMAQIRIDGFDGVGLLFIGAHFIRSTIIQSVVTGKSITVILPGLRRTFQTGLERLRRSVRDNIPAQHTVSVPIHYSKNIDFVFFSPIKVYSSSSSAFFTLLGTGAGPSLAVY